MIQPNKASDGRSEGAMLDGALSRKLKVIGLIAIILVVYLHSYNLFISPESGANDPYRTLNLFVQGLISRNVGKIAVPLFFAISGFLFFIKIENSPRLGWFFTQIRKRIRSLLLPYLLWNALGIGVFLLRDQLSGVLSGKGVFAGIDFLRLLDELLFHPEISYQLWFLRDLIILVMFSPLIYFCVSRLRVFALLPLISLWMFDVKLPLINVAGILFFCVGAAVALNVIPLRKQVSVPVTGFWLFLWLILISINAYWYSVGITTPPAFDQICILTGLFSVWFAYDVSLRCGEFVLLPAASFSFFIYAFHEPLMSVIKSRLINRVGATEIERLPIFILLPLFIIVVSLIVGYAMQAIMPRTYRLMTGGR